MSATQKVLPIVGAEFGAREYVVPFWTWEGLLEAFGVPDDDAKERERFPEDE